MSNNLLNPQPKDLSLLEFLKEAEGQLAGAALAASPRRMPLNCYENASAVSGLLQTNPWLAICRTQLHYVYNTYY
jgi:hypothetical protein